MAKRLPFIVEPKPITRQIGNPNIGVLEIEVKGDLTINEIITIAEIESGVSIFEMTSKAALEISEAEGLDLMRVYYFVSAAAVDAEVEQDLIELKVKYHEKIKAISSAILDRATMSQLAIVTAIIKHRLHPDWTLEDSTELPAKLVNEIYTFAQNEQEGVIPETKITSVDVKKPQRGRQKKEQTGLTPTGV